MIVREQEVVIVGAGAAGIGAGLALSRLGVPYLILEAKDRVGGRAYTDIDTFGRAWDCGSHWYYSADRNPLRVLADRLEHPYEKKTTDWINAVHLGTRWARDEEVVEARAYVAAKFAHIKRTSEDVSIADVLSADDTWSGLMRDRVAQLGANEAENISALDYANFEDTNRSYAATGGVGLLFEAMARGLPVRTDCMVKRIDIRDDAVEVEADDETFIRAGAVIMTVSAGVLNADVIEFAPELPDGIVQSLGAISMGCAEKVALSLRSDPFGLSEPSRVQLPAGEEGDVRHFFFELLPNGRTLVVAHLGGDVVKELRTQSDAALVDFAVSALKSAYGSDVAAQVGDSAVTNWLNDPHIRGAFSTTRPGQSAARKALREPIGARVYLAGEATSVTQFATCQGAYMSGIDAAHRAAEMLGHWKVDPDPHWLPIFGS